MILRGFCLLLLLAPPALAGRRITSFEPDTTTHERPAPEPMVETPIWYGLAYSISSYYQQDLEGLKGNPERIGGIATGVTWPWRNRLQGWSEFAYLVRTIREQQSYWNSYIGRYEHYVADESCDMFTVRGGVEHRFGSKGRPWCTAGAGVGAGFSLGETASAATEVLARVTGFLYPSRYTRLGLMLSAGPAWIVLPRRSYLLSSGPDEQNPTRTHYEIGLRIESRLRFPRANAD